MIVCFFDIDGTLLSTGGAGQAAMEAALAAEFRAQGTAERGGWSSAGIAFAGRTDRAIVEDFFTFFGVEPDEEKRLRFMRAYLQQLPGHLQRKQGAVLPGVARLLGELSRTEGVLLGLLTGNFREGARLKLEHYRLYDYFLFGGYGDAHCHRDDVAREALAEAERHHGRPFERERVWVIGDTPADVACARAIGAKAVAVATGTFSRDDLHATSPDHLFDSFAEPAAFLELLPP